jgi:hypothetical protein
MDVFDDAAVCIERRVQARIASHRIAVAASVRVPIDTLQSLHPDRWIERTVSAPAANPGFSSRRTLIPVGYDEPSVQR